MSTGFNGPIGDSWRTEIKKLKEVENMECESTYTNTKTLAPTSEEKPNIVFEALYKKQVNRITMSLCQKCPKNLFTWRSRHHWDPLHSPITDLATVLRAHKLD